MGSKPVWDYGVSDITMPALNNNTTTTTTTTAHISTIPTGTVASSCQTSVPDYKTLRQQNFSTITEYYNNLLSNYTKNYTDYTTQKNSTNVNDRTYAETNLKPKITDYNTQMIAISKTVIDSVDRDTDLILDQKNQLLEKTTKVDNLINDIKMLKDKDSELLILFIPCFSVNYSCFSSKKLKRAKRLKIEILCSKMIQSACNQ